MARASGKSKAGGATSSSSTTAAGTAAPGPLAVKQPATPGTATANTSAATGAGGSSSTGGGTGATPPSTPQTNATSTTFVTKAARILEFNLRGTTTPVIAATWEQLVAITDNEWDDIERTIAEFEAQGPPGTFVVDWLKVLSTTARKEFLGQHQYRCAVGKDDADIFDNKKYAKVDQIERIRFVAKKDLGHQTTEQDVEDQQLQAASAIAAWIKKDAEIVPPKDAQEDHFFKEIRTVIARNMTRRDLDLDVINDADLVERTRITRAH